MSCDRRNVAGPGRGEIYLKALLSPDRATIASLCVSGDVLLWKAATGERIGQLTAPQSQLLSSAAFSPDGQMLATGTVDGMVRLWRRADGSLLWGQNVISGNIDRLQFSPDGSTLAVIGNAKRFCLLAPQTGAMIAPPICNDSSLKSAEWVDAAGRVLTVDVDGVGRLWNLENNVPVLRLPHTNEILLASISADRRVLATTEGGGAVCLLNLPPEGRPDAGGLKLVQVGDLNIDGIALNADGSQLAISSADRQVSIWDAREAKKHVGPLLHSDRVQLMRFSQDGALLVCVSNDGRATVWDVASGRRVYEPLDVSQFPTDLDIDRDGKRCAVAAIRGVTIWDLTTGNRVRPGFFAGNSKFARFVNDPQALLVASMPSGRMKVWDITTAQSVRTFSNKTGLESLALSDDRRLCLAGYRDGTARLLSSGDGTAASPSFDCPSAPQAASIDQTSAGLRRSRRIWIFRYGTPRLRSCSRHCGHAIWNPRSRSERV